MTDDMALCHPSLQLVPGKLTVTDAEDAWFVRVNHIDRYGTDVHLERLTAQPAEPLLFMSIDAVPDSRAISASNGDFRGRKNCTLPTPDARIS